MGGSNFYYLGLVIQSISVLMGVAFFLGGILKLKRYGEMRTFMSHQMTIWAPLMMLVTAVLLLCLPLTIKAMALSLWGKANPMSYVSASPNPYVQKVILLLRLFGVCSFMRGVVLLARSGQEQSQPGALSKSMIHMLSGLFCVYIESTIAVLKALLGTSFGF